MNCCLEWNQEQGDDKSMVFKLRICMNWEGDEMEPNVNLFID